MSTIGTALYKFLARTFSGVDWQQGSIVRELVAEPIIGLSDEASSVINNEYAKLNINTLLSNPTEHSTEIDELFADLGFESPTPTQSTGTVRILTTAYTDITLATGTMFTYENTILRTPDQFRLTLFPQGNNDIQITQIGIDAYEAIVPVQSAATGVSLAAGTPLEWTGIDNSIYEVSVADAITGGIGTYTAVQKINLIRQRLFPVALTCAQSVLRTLNYLVPNSAVDCLFAEQSTGGKTKVYVKTTGAPTTWKVTADSQAVSGSTREVRIPSVGVDRVVSVNGVQLPSASVSVENIGKQLLITFSGTSVETAIEVYGLPQLPELQAAVDSFTRGTGIDIELLTPTLLDSSIYLPVTGGPVPTTLIADIVTAVNGTLLNTTLVGDTLTRPLVADAGLTMSGTGTYTLKSAENDGVRSATTASDPDPFRAGNKPYAIYTYINSVAVVNV